MLRNRQEDRVVLIRCFVCKSLTERIAAAHDYDLEKLYENYSDHHYMYHSERSERPSLDTI